MDASDDDTDDGEAAWENALVDMRAMVEAREEAGWDALGVAAGKTVPEHRAGGDSSRYGLTFIVDEDHTDEFGTLFNRGEFPKYEVYRSELDGEVFLVVELLDPDAEVAILGAGRYDLADAAEMVHDAEMTGEMYTHFWDEGGFHLATFRHDGHEKFVPHADRIDEFAE